MEPGKQVGIEAYKDIGDREDRYLYMTKRLHRHRVPA